MQQLNHEHRHPVQAVSDSYERVSVLGPPLHRHTSIEMVYIEHRLRSNADLLRQNILRTAIALVN